MRSDSGGDRRTEVTGKRRGRLCNAELIGAGSATIGRSSLSIQAPRMRLI
jgi:hypothetical protein